MHFDKSDFLSLACSVPDVVSFSYNNRQLVDFGVETTIPVLKTCLDCFTVRRSQADTLQLEKLLSLVFKRVMKKSNLGTLLSHALEDVEVTEKFVDDLTNALDFSISEKIGFGLALADFERSDAKTSGKADSSHVLVLISLTFICLMMPFWSYLLQDGTYYWL